MQLDIRVPIGLMFAIIGGILMLYGLLSTPAIYQRSLGINLNLWWGLVLLVFGGAMLALGRRAGAARRTSRAVEEREKQLGLER